MGDYEIGYGKPPRQSQFKKGVCANPRGRGKRAELQVDDVMDDILSAPVAYKENGRVKTISRRELSIRRLFAAALNGDVASADAILRLRAHAVKCGDAGPLHITIVNDPDRGRLRKPRTIG